jgi:hypothetical protein
VIVDILSYSLISCFVMGRGWINSSPFPFCC